MSAESAKKFPKSIRARNWTLFAEVLADEEHNFAAALEELALKKRQTMKFLHLPKKY